MGALHQKVGTEGYNRVWPPGVSPQGIEKKLLEPDSTVAPKGAMVDPP